MWELYKLDSKIQGIILLNIIWCNIKCIVEFQSYAQSVTAACYFFYVTPDNTSVTAKLDLPLLKSRRGSDRGYFNWNCCVDGNRIYVICYYFEINSTRTYIYSLTILTKNVIPNARSNLVLFFLSKSSSSTVILTPNVRT